MRVLEYRVQVTRSDDGLRALSTVRDFALELGAHRGDPSVGFNAVETLLSALGECFTTSFGFVAELSHVAVRRLRVAVEGTREDRPPVIREIRYTAYIECDAPDEKVDRLLSLAERNSTVISTLRAAVPVTGEWRRHEEESE